MLVDEYRIGQVFTNLVGNALQYTPQAGRVVISAVAEADFVRISVADTGAGLAIEHLEHVFDRFYRVDKSRSRAAGGSGIGLTIARYLVEAHGGRIWAESSGEGQGSTFTFTLPVAKNDRLSRSQHHFSGPRPHRYAATPDDFQAIAVHQ